MRGSRVKNIVRELSGEKIDIIRWHADVRKYIEEALSPAHVKDIIIDEENKRVRVVVHDDQLSLAIGKRGQNARLTSKLTGWHVDIASVEQIEAEKAALISEEVIEVYEEVEAGAEGEDVEYETVTVYEEVPEEEEAGEEPAADEPGADEPAAKEPAGAPEEHASSEPAEAPEEHASPEPAEEDSPGEDLAQDDEKPPAPGVSPAHEGNPVE